MSTPFRLLPHRTMPLFLGGLLTLLAFTTAEQVRAAQVPRKPNVILIMADDFGYECVGANGGTSYKTPHLDRLAAQGMRFEHCHVQPLCTPTRVQLMTGLYNVRNYTRFGHLDPAQRTFAHLFQQAGYATAIVGKWQLGQEVDLPRRFGFDESFLWQHTRRPPRYANPGLEHNGKELDYTNGEYGPDLINAYALDFIARNKDRPFLLYYPMILTHSPFQPTPDSPNWDPKAMGEKVNQNPKHFIDMVAYADKMVGRLVAALENHQLRDRTLILFLGDNGTPTNITSQMGERTVRGGKGSTRHTGTHVPLIAHWPGVIPAGRVNHDLVDSTDFLPTICAAAGISLPDNIPFDGRSFWPQLRGEPGQPREWIYCWYAREGGAVAQKEFAMTHRFKLYRDGAFFDLLQDLDEERPLAADALTEEAAAARKRLQAVLDQFQDARPPALQQPAPKSDSPGAAANHATSEDVLAGLRAFWQQTALPDGSFRPGIDPAYPGMSDSAASNLAPATYAVTLHKTFGWKLPYEAKTIAWFLDRQQPDGAFVNTAGTMDPQSPLARLYNTTQGLVALRALGTKPRYQALPVLEAILREDYKTLPAYTTSFFPLAYQAAGQRFPAEHDAKIRALMPQTEDGYVFNHVASTFHAVHYYRLMNAPTPKAEALLRRMVRDQKPDGSWSLNPPARDRHACFDAVFTLHQLGHHDPTCRQAIQRAAQWVLTCRNPDGGFGHYPGSPSDADAVYFHVGVLVMAGFLKPVDPPPADPHLLSWGHLMPLPQ